MPLTGLTILEVDDNEAHNYALSRQLEHANCKVLRAHNGMEALALAREKPDAILLDIDLPDISGFEVCRRIRKDPATAAIPVIFLTATYRDANAADMAESAGAKAILFYPVETAQLLTVIRGQLMRAATTKHLQ